MIIRLSHCETVNVKASSGKQSGHLAQYTGTVFNQYGIYSLHLSTAPFVILPDP